MHVSVIIPVYNAARFLEEAIESVLMQQEVKEILLIDDGSKDASLSICQRYVASHPRIIKLLQHPGNNNLGAGETRNLGILQATSKYVAFLDADDKYLPLRFTETINTFEKRHDADGVYETVGMMKEEHGLSEDVVQRAGAEQARVVCDDPSRLFSTLAIAKSGYIHLNGLTLKRSSINASLLFDPALRQCQDTDLLLRWSASKTLYGTNPDRHVALRRVHDQNRVFNLDEALYYRYLCMRKCALNEFYGSVDRKAKWAILNRLARASSLVTTIRSWPVPVTPFRILVFVTFLIRHPRVLINL